MNHPSQLSIPPNQDQALSLADYQTVQSLPGVWAIAAQQFAEVIALKDPHHQPAAELTYAQVHQQIQQFAAGLQALGVTGSEAPVGLIADNSHRWFIADQGIMLAGVADAVRSPQANREELLFILADSGSTILVAEDRTTLDKLQPQLSQLPIRLIVLLFGEPPAEDYAAQVISFSQVLEMGQEAIAAQTFHSVPRNRESLATLIYTSGTSGKPKGVMLSHGNLLHQVETLGDVIQPSPGEHVLSILPIWHVYERGCSYFLLSRGCTQIYTNIRYFKQDIKTYQPHFIVGVPRLWESIYDGVQKQFREQPPRKQQLINFFLATSQRYIEAQRIVQDLSLKHLNPSAAERLAAGLQMTVLGPLHTLADKAVYRQVRQATGGRLKQLFSGGGSLSMYLENFFEMVGIQIQMGYGLTETSPVLSARRSWHNLRGSSGKPIPATEIRIIDPESRQPLPLGERGIIVARGPQIMQGYYKNPEATAKAIDAEGWFDTGDLGWLTPENDVIITGRAKDTIVLTNGENIEPQPIEDACLRSPYIDQIVLVGQDQRSLGALIVPNLETFQRWATEQNYWLKLPNTPSSEEPPPDLKPIALDSKPIQALFRQELNREVKDRPGYRADDRIGPFRLLLEPFSIENGMLTQKLTIRRFVVMERYRDMINGMFD